MKCRECEESFNAIDDDMEDIDDKEVLKGFIPVEKYCPTCLCLIREYLESCLEEYRGSYGRRG